MAMKKYLAAALAAAALCSAVLADACTRVVYLGPDGMVLTGRTMDWREDPRTNLYLFPRGMERRGAKSDHTIRWVSKYGSVCAAGYDIGVADGMNEKGLVGNLLFLTETIYALPDDDRPVMGLSIWLQYVLDNFATVSEAVEELRRDRFRIDAPDLPNGVAARLHLSLSDPSGNSAVVEYIDGKQVIYEGREYRVLTNSPAYDLQLAVDAYWQQIGGERMLPGTNRSSDRFVRASYYVEAVAQSPDARIAVPALLSVLRNVSVPYGITTPGKPNIASTIWRSVCDQKNLVYYFDRTLHPDVFWVDFSSLDFGAGQHERKLTLTGDETYSGNVADRFVAGERLDFLFGI